MNTVPVFVISSKRRSVANVCFLLQGQIQRQLNWLEADLIKVKSNYKTKGQFLY